MTDDTHISAPSTYRGHPIRYCLERRTFVYVDNDQPVPDTWQDRPCAHCGLESTPEGHDGCLGALEGVTNACCGHGEPETAYVQFDDGSELREGEAVAYFEEVASD
jgi:hypothetical protein